eukprot:jgi/Hompol1/4819/HPOL_003903-RA
MDAELALLREQMELRRTIVFVGDEATGKSQIINVLRASVCSLYAVPCQRAVRATLFSVVGMFVFHLATIEDSYPLDDYPNVTVVDTAGSSAFDRLRPFSYEGATDVVICFAVDSHQSFEQVQEKWVPEARFFCAGRPVSLLATKSDLRNDPAVVENLSNLGLAPISTLEGKRLARAIRASAYYECSAKNAKEVASMFNSLLAHAPERKSRISLTNHANHKHTADGDSLSSSDDEKVKASLRSVGGDGSKLRPDNGLYDPVKSRGSKASLRGGDGRAVLRPDNGLLDPVKQRSSKASIRGTSAAGGSDGAKLLGRAPSPGPSPADMPMPIRRRSIAPPSMEALAARRRSTVAGLAAAAAAASALPLAQDPSGAMLNRSETTLGIRRQSVTPSISEVSAFVNREAISAAKRPSIMPVPTPLAEMTMAADVEMQSMAEEPEPIAPAAAEPTAAEASTSYPIR